MTRSDNASINLEHFLPYRLSVLSNTVSSAIAGAYARRFGLTISEWRVIAVLGRFARISASEVANKTAMDKVAVSRAVNRLVKAGLLHREIAEGDRRRSELTLTARGTALLDQVAPMAIEYESRLLEGFTPGDRQRLERALSRLLDRARQIGPLGET